MELGSKTALARAVENVESKYEVVGVIEELRATLIMLESRIPSFFRGAEKVMKILKRSKYCVVQEKIHAMKQRNVLHSFSIPEVHKSHNKVMPSEEALKKLRGKFTLEYEFYEYVKSRLLAT